MSECFVSNGGFIHANYNAHEGPRFILFGFAQVYLSLGSASKRFANLIFTITATPQKR
jgi:hypothetical protein